MAGVRTGLARWAAALLAFTSAHCGAAAPSEKAFSAELKQRLEAKHPGAVLTSDPNDPLSLRVQAGGGLDEGTVNLHRIFGFCKTVPGKECERVKAEFVEKLTLKEPTYSPTSLRLILRDAQYLSYIKSLPPSRDRSAMGIYRQVGDDLYAFLASDGATTIALVPPEGLETLNLSQDEAWALAWKQTRSALPALPTRDALAKRAVVYEGHDYGGALLLDTRGWSDVARAVGPDLFVTVVSDKFLFVGVMPDGEGLTKFGKTVAEDCAQQERCISPHVYRFREGRWVIARQE